MHTLSEDVLAGLDLRRRRLRYRLWHRGTREMDLIMGRFIDAVIGEAAETDVGDLERLSEVPDPELHAWVSGAAPVSPSYDTPVFRRLQQFYSPCEPELGRAGDEPGLTTDRPPQGATDRPPLDPAARRRP